jgi:hypothetical protein
MSPDDRNRFADRGFSERGPDRGADRDFAGDRNLASGRGADDRNLASDRGFSDRGLEAQLAEAGRAARQSDAGSRPDAVFAAELRERLVARLETDAAPVGWPFGLFQRAARLVPVSAAAILFAAAIVGASQLNIGSSDPTEPPVAATDQPAPTDGWTSFLPEGTDNPFPVVPVVTPSPEDHPTATPQPTPTPPPPPAEPTPAPPSGPAAMTLSLKSCDGGVVISWSKYKGADFNHYTTLRNTTATIPMAYPPQGGAVDFGGTYTTDPSVLSAVDTSGAPWATYYYRAMAFNVEDDVVGASDVISAQAKPTLALGALVVAPDAGGTRFTWSPYTGPGACFTYYKLVASTTDPDPSYLDGDPYLWAGSWQGESTVVSADLVSGQTYYLRLQAIRTTALGAFVAAETTVTTYLVP